LLSEQGKGTAVTIINRTIFVNKVRRINGKEDHWYFVPLMSQFTVGWWQHAGPEGTWLAAAVLPVHAVARSARCCLECGESWPLNGGKLVKQFMGKTVATD